MATSDQTTLLSGDAKHDEEKPPKYVVALRATNLLGIIVTMLVNFIIGSGVANIGSSVGDISRKNPTLITPAGTFTCL